MAKPKVRLNGSQILVDLVLESKGETEMKDETKCPTCGQPVSSPEQVLDCNVKVQVECWLAELPGIIPVNVHPDTRQNWQNDGATFVFEFNPDAVKLDVETFRQIVQAGWRDRPEELEAILVRSEGKFHTIFRAWWD